MLSKMTVDLKKIMPFRRSLGEVLITCPRCGSQELVIVFTYASVAQHTCYDCQQRIEITIKENEDVNTPDSQQTINT